MRQFKRKALVTCIAVSTIASLSAYASDKKIGDLSIYRAAQDNTPSINLMFDTSGSMGKSSLYYDFDVPENNGRACYNNYQARDKRYTYINPEDSTETFTVVSTLRGCDSNRSGEIDKLDRLSRLKDAILTLMTTGIVDTDLKVSMGVFPMAGTNGKAGSIVVPVPTNNKLDFTQRQLLANAIKDLVANGGTPTANALAEAGAYMMGTNTTLPNNLESRAWTLTGIYGLGIGYKAGRKYFRRCSTNNNAEASRVQLTVGSTEVTTESVKNCNAYATANLQSVQAQPSTEGYRYLRTEDNIRYYAFYSVPATTGSGFANSSVSTKSGANYTRAASLNQCAANGIYLLTDGTPNSSSKNIASQLMNQSLVGSGSTISECNSLLNDGTESPEGAAWGCMGDYAKVLNSNDNVINRPIKVATAGLGTTFSGFPSDEDGNIDCEGTMTAADVPAGTAVPSAPNPDARNLCRLGAKSGDLGKGSFTYVQTSEELQSSILEFLEDLSDTISAAPAGTITIPSDPLSSLNVQPFAYLPMLEPEVSSTKIIWPGNLKKYNVANGTLFGANNNRLYTVPEVAQGATAETYPYKLNGTTRDLWMQGPDNIVRVSIPGSDTGQPRFRSVVENSAVDVGGVYARLRAPSIIPATPASSNYSTRTVYVEDEATDGSANRSNRLVKVGVDENGTELVGFDELQSSVYTPEIKAYLLNFLGFNVSTDPATYANLSEEQVTARLISQLALPANEIKVLGGVIHSKPVLVSYGGEFNAEDKDTLTIVEAADQNGVITTTITDGADEKIDPDAGQIATEESRRDDFIMFGSMDGALHLAKAETGEETFAVIPLTMIETQHKALKKNSIDNIEPGAPKFGVDGPWTSKATYRFNLEANKIEATSVRAYGGLRMGGLGMYGMDFSNKATPKILFSLTKNQGGKFKRMGQTWSKPLVTSIRTGTGPDDVQEVIVFGGGYDMCYESPTFKLSTATDASTTIDDCNRKSATYGNAVYMVDAETGALVATWSGDTTDASGTNIGNNETSPINDSANMTHSVVGNITGLDRNANGTIDHLYFADLGGQVFRIDLQEGVEAANMTKRLVKVFDANEGVDTPNHIPYRFYERPLVSFYKTPAGRRFAAINIASGDRSSPLARRSVADANRVYGIFDRDVAEQGLYGNLTLVSQSLNTAKLTALPFTTAENREKLTQDMSIPSDLANRDTYESQGWYYPLVRFDGYNNVPNVKAVGEGTVIGNVYYMTAYSPNMTYGNERTCEAGITGGSERELYCMPYGICNQKLDADGNVIPGSDSPLPKVDGVDTPTVPAGTRYMSDSGTGGYTRAGPGIQDLVLGAVSKDQRNTRVLIGTRTITDRVLMTKRNDVSEGNIDSVNGLRFGSGDDSGDVVDTGDTGANVAELGGDGSALELKVEEGLSAVPERWYELQNRNN